MNNPAAALVEMDHAIEKLGTKGIQILTRVNGRALDEPEIFQIFERITHKHKMPVWMHPTRPASKPDYANEDKSKYEIWQVLGWPVETSVAMSRMVFSGLLDRLPGLRLITHHCGGMLPYFAGRAETLWTQMGSRGDGSEANVLKSLSKPPLRISRCFTATPCWAGPARHCAAVWTSLAPTKWCLPATARLTPKKGPCSSARGFDPLKTWISIGIGGSR